MQNTQDAVVARSEEVGNFSRQVASNKQSRIWALVGKCKRKPFRLDTVIGDKAMGPWEALVFIGGAAMPVAGNAPGSLWEVGALQRPLASSQNMKKHPKDHLLWLQRATSLLCKEILNNVVYLRYAICLGVSPLRKNGTRAGNSSIMTFLLWLRCFCPHFLNLCRKKELSEYACSQSMPKLHPTLTYQGSALQKYLGTEIPWQFLSYWNASVELLFRPHLFVSLVMQKDDSDMQCSAGSITLPIHGWLVDGNDPWVRFHLAWLVWRGDTASTHSELID